jgi:hypothetical protein
VAFQEFQHSLYENFIFFNEGLQHLLIFFDKTQNILNNVEAALVI